MSVAAFLSDLRRRDIRVWVEQEALRCNAPAGALTRELREQLTLRKRDIVTFLKMADSAAAQPTAIVPLQQNGSKPPIFGVHGGGDVFCYSALSQALGEDQPFFGLQAPGLDGRSEPLTRVEDMAAYYAEQIRAFRPRGPWIIAGKCVGGTVAFELARQLHAGGDAPAFLALFGAPYPTFCRPLGRVLHRIEYRAERVARRSRMLAAQSARERLEYLSWRLRGRRAKVAPDPAMLLHQKVMDAMVRAVRVYEPRPFAGRVYHFWPTSRWARRPHVRAGRWCALAAGGEAWSGPNGCTEEEMLLAQYAPLFAQHFRQACAREGI
jgi:thioesterase domain-containing protein